nr:hypothetical protein [Armatimonas sp.]
MPIDNTKCIIPPIMLLIYLERKTNRIVDNIRFTAIVIMIIEYALKVGTIIPNNTICARIAIPTHAKRCWVLNGGMVAMMRYLAAPSQ